MDKRGVASLAPSGKLGGLASVESQPHQPPRPVIDAQKAGLLEQLVAQLLAGHSPVAADGAVSPAFDAKPFTHDVDAGDWKAIVRLAKRMRAHIILIGWSGRTRTMALSASRRPRVGGREPRRRRVRRGTRRARAPGPEPDEPDDDLSRPPGRRGR
jgi:hypothetical protein